MPQVAEQLACYHCGEPCSHEITQDDKHFCCTGCKAVYQILSEHDLCTFYDLDAQAGRTQQNVQDVSFAYLDESSIRKKMLEFDSDQVAIVKFFVPAIHCVSCLWLLENLMHLNAGIIKSEVNFAKKTVRITFKPNGVKLSAVADTLAGLGYAPQISLASLTVGQKEKAVSRSLVIQLAVAGFCFGNIMLFSFPEYLGLDGEEAKIFRPVFSILNFALSIPVLVYSARDYFLAAWRAIKQSRINIDVPIAVGLTVLFVRSVYDVLSLSSPGYFDSLAGLVFFLLVGRWFQGKTYANLAFDRDYQSYFPLAVQCWESGHWKPVVIYEIKKGDRIRIKNNEIVPADCLLIDDEAYIDYSFVTGESQPIAVSKGGGIYAGGKLVGKPVELVVEKETSQSYLTGLWNEDAYTKPKESRYKTILDKVARWFTWTVLSLAIFVGIVWFYADATKVWNVVTSILIVACPCALALAAPFTYGSVTRVFGRWGLFLKNADVVEQLADVDAVVFDKTGTVTYGKGKMTFVGNMSASQSRCVGTLLHASTHPLSRWIAEHFFKDFDQVDIADFAEIPGKGIQGTHLGVLYRIGSASFVGHQEKAQEDNSPRVYISLGDDLLGYYIVETMLRPSIKNVLSKLKVAYMALLSGDGAAELNRMKDIFPAGAALHFNKTPKDKLHYVSDLQSKGYKVMMIGDGLNDAGALKQSDVGLSISDDQGVFSPACDGILLGDKLSELVEFKKLAQSGKTIVKIAFGISLLYNLFALSVAAFGYLSPLLAAILMPLSSISVVALTTLAVNQRATQLVNNNTKLT